MTPPLLLDTCAAIWIAGGDPISRAAIEALAQSYAGGQDIHVSPISAWEIGLLAARGRLQTIVTPQVWFKRFLAVPAVKLSAMSADILIASSFLPGVPPRDPADRIIIATAREEGLVIVTRDRTLLDYALEGHVAALEC